MGVMGTLRRHRGAAGAVSAVLALMVGFTLWHVVRAAHAGTTGRRAIIAAESDLLAQRVDAARHDLTVARRAFAQVGPEMDRLGVLGSIGGHLPVVGRQLRATAFFAAAGMEVCDAGLHLVDAATAIVHPADQHLPVSAALDALRATDQSLLAGINTLASVSARVATLKGAFLVGSLASARTTLTVRLPRIERRARASAQGLAAFIAFAGGSGPKRYLFLSQNPEEVRPTGGFIGTYGVLTAAGGRLTLQRYDAMEHWTDAHPEADVPPTQVGPPFKYHHPPLRQNIGNVNTTPNWPQAAMTAAKLWQQGGEQPVDGVISFTPAFLARILSVVGPIEIPSYGETVTAANLADRLDYQTHQAQPPAGAYRKDFVSVVAEAVMADLVVAPASEWEPLGRAMGQGFDAREAMAWSNDPEVAPALAVRHWDGSFPKAGGDFLYDSEFEYAAKNGAGIRRTFDHRVALRPDGSARVTTTVTITDTEPAGDLNVTTLAYLTMYGPEGGVLDEQDSDPFGLPEPTLAGHPAVGWFRAAGAGGGQATLTVVWDVPALVNRVGHRAWAYDLSWPHLPGHRGDVARLSFDLPSGWHWKAAPPGRLRLDADVTGHWVLVSR